MNANTIIRKIIEIYLLKQKEKRMNLVSNLNSLSEMAGRFEILCHLEIRYSLTELFSKFRQFFSTGSLLL